METLQMNCSVLIRHNQIVLIKIGDLWYRNLGVDGFPSIVEAVCSISGRYDLIGTTLGLSACGLTLTDSLIDNEDRTIYRILKQKRAMFKELDKMHSTHYTLEQMLTVQGMIQNVRFTFPNLYEEIMQVVNLYNSSS